MKLAFFEVPGGNFGDDLNNWLWDDLLPGWRDWDDETVLVGVGTVLKQGFLPEDCRKLVLGSGVGYGKQPDIGGDGWDVRAVRGPLSADALGFPAELGIVDPAVMVPRLARFANIEKTDEVLFVPHHATGLLDWQAACDAAGVTYLSPAGDCETVIRRIAGARLVIAESMHAAIFADAFRTPWHAVALSRGFNTFKWRDWAGSLGHELNIHRFLGPLRKVQALVSPLPAKGSVTGPKPGTSPTKGEGKSAKDESSASVLLQFAARRFIARLAKKDGELTSGKILEQKRDRYEAMLEDVKRDYG